MADNSITGQYRILPAYPVKPPQPADKERDSEKQPPARQRREEKPDEERPGRPRDDDNDDNPVIDEYV